MNKNDIKLIIITLFLALLFIVGIKLINSNGQKHALVYYENNLVLKIDLTINERREFNIQGYNGNILIISEDGKVKVEEEISPLHLCSKQGWISSVNQMIVCLPNKVVIKIAAEENLDAVIR